MPVRLPSGAANLPPIGGRLFSAYRIGWWLLAALAVASLLWSGFDSAAAAAILALRLVKGAILVAVSSILYRRRGSDPVAAMLAIAFLLWTISSSVDFLAVSTLAALTDRLRFLFFALALLLFPGGGWSPGWTRPVAVAILATFLLGIAEAIGLAAPGYYLPLAIGCVVAALLALFSRYRALGSGVARQQLKWVILGLVIGIGLILLARGGAALGLAMESAGALLLEAMFQLGIVVIAVGFLTSLLRFRLYDAEAAISRSAVYAGLTLVLVGVFTTSEVLIELLGERYFGMAIGNVSGAIAAGSAAVLLTPLHGRISSWAERYFQHDLVALKEELPDLLAILSASASAQRLATATLPKIEAALHATRILLMLDGRLIAAQGIAPLAARRLLRGLALIGSEGAIERDDDSPLPLRLALRCPQGSMRGWLLLGPRPDGSFYGRDDLEALTEIAPPLQRALILAAEREAQERRHRRERGLMRRRLDELQERLNHLERSAGFLGG